MQNNKTIIEDKTTCLKNRETGINDAIWLRGSRAVAFCKKGVLRNVKFTETLAQLLSCEFCEISKNTFSYKTPPVAASRH